MDGNNFNNEKLTSGIKLHLKMIDKPVVGTTRIIERTNTYNEIVNGLEMSMFHGLGRLECLKCHSNCDFGIRAWPESMGMFRLLHVFDRS